MNHSVFQLLQAMIAPGIMVVACGLLLIGMNNKYSLIVSRIRFLKDEKLRLFGKIGENDSGSNRISNIELQISHLIHRIAMVRNSVMSYSAAIALFIVNSILIGLKSNSLADSFYWITISFFFAGLLAVFTGIIFAAIEVWKAYRIVRIEISEIYNDKEL